jgi:hypothetical protein
LKVPKEVFEIGGTAISAGVSVVWVGSLIGEDGVLPVGVGRVVGDGIIVASSSVS